MRSEKKTAHSKRAVLVIGGGFLQLPIIKKIQELGLRAVVFDGNPEAPGMGLADDACVCDISDAEACVSVALQLRDEAASNQDGPEIAGVLTAGTDRSYAVSRVAEALDLPGIQPEDALAATNKVLMRRRLAESGVDQPRFRGLWKFSEAHQAMDELGLPLVIKPAENMGARGVRLIRRREEIYEAWRHARQFSKTGELILEEFIGGRELSVDALAWKDESGTEQTLMTGIADRIIYGEPYFIELGHTMPSQEEPEILKKAEDAMRAAMQALGIAQGAAKGDLRIREDGSIAIGEVAARLSGGFMSSHTFPLASGVDLLGAAVQIALGESPAIKDARYKRVAIERALIGPPGKILRLEGLSAMKQESGISDVFFMKKPGDVLFSLTSNLGKAGHILATGDSLAEAEDAVNRARRHFLIEVDDSFGIDWKEVEKNAREAFGSDICIVCKTCDGRNCASGIPGMGGPGKMQSFIDNSQALSEYRIVPSYIHQDVSPQTTSRFLSEDLAFPMMLAPMTGASTNMGGALNEYDLASILLEAASEMGSIAWLGDGASPERYKTILRAVRDTKARALLICKPRADTKAIRTRFSEAEDAGVLALGMDIDAFSLKTLEHRQAARNSLARDVEALSEIRSMTSLPFILKGIMTQKDAEAALRIGADVVVVSNHGGRILDEMPGTARVLPEIADTLSALNATKPNQDKQDGRKIQILADGGIRSGADAFKMLALGAEAVLIGRMAAIAAVGGGKRAVKHLLRTYGEELRRAMKLCGAASPKDITKEFLFREVAGPSE